jgi:hypothetical protein
MISEPGKAFQVDIPRQEWIVSPLLINRAEDSFKFVKSYKSKKPNSYDTVLNDAKPAHFHPVV